MSTRFIFNASGLRHTFRGLRRQPGFTVAAVLTLALGIGATTAIFSVVYGVLIKPLPYPDAHELVSIRHAAPGLTADELAATSSMYVTYRQETRSFEHIGLWGNGGQTLTGLGEPEQVRAAFASDGMLQALGVQPLLGRRFTASEHMPSADGPDAVILSYAFWQRRFGGDEGALGQALSLDSRPAQVVGVMPPGFRFLNMTPQPDVISPFRIDDSEVALGAQRVTHGLSGFAFEAIGRLRDGVTLAEANADIARMLPIWLESWPPPRGGATRDTVADWRLAPVLRPLKDYVVGNVGGMLWVLMGTVAAVLLIACANVANLLLVRADARRQELTIRAALGAGRAHIAGELLRESLVLGAIGGIAGLVLAYGALALLAALAPASLPRVEDIAMSPPVLAFAAAAALLSSLSFGSIPALKQAFGRGAPLAGGARGASASRERNRTRNVLIVVQVALALVLLVGAGLMIRTFQALNDVDPGFTDPEHVQVARIWIPPSVMPEPERYTRVQRDILERIEALPGVTAAGFGFGVPLEGRTVENAVWAEDRPYVAGQTPLRRFKFVSPGYLEALGTRLVAGRDLTWRDIEQGGRVALVSESFARELWGEPQAAIGKRIRERADGGPWREIVGVTQDVHEDALHQRPPSIVFWPILMEDFGGNAMNGTPAIAYAIRSERAGTEGLMSEVRQAVWASDANLPIFLVRTMQELYSAARARTSFALVILALAAAMALCLGVVGVYGVISYVVAQRAREVGIRLALGATSPLIKRMFVRHAFALAAVGVAAGLAVAIAFARWMTSLLFEVQPLDPATYVAVIGVLVAAVTAAAYVPARRAAMLDPVATLRAE